MDGSSAAEAISGFFICWAVQYGKNGGSSQQESQKRFRI